MNTTVPQKKTTVIPGKWMVLGMFALGITSTSTLWIYWNLHTAPYRPLREAILAEYPKSAPRVEGGQRKMHRDTPKLFRIVMKLDFDPNREDKTEELNSITARVTQLAIEHAELLDYEQFELHYFWPEKEKMLHQRTISQDVAEIAETSSR